MKPPQFRVPTARCRSPEKANTRVRLGSEASGESPLGGAIYAAVAETAAIESPMATADSGTAAVVRTAARWTAQRLGNVACLFPSRASVASARTSSTAGGDFAE